MTEPQSPIPLLRFCSRVTGLENADGSWKPVAVLESIARLRHLFLSRCLRIFDLALKRRDFTADSEMNKVFAVCANEACSR
jgi:hypothetical protein